MKQQMNLADKLTITVFLSTLLLNTSYTLGGEAKIVEGEGGLDIFLEADNYPGVYLNFVCRGSLSGSFHGILVLHFAEDAELEGEIVKLKKSAYQLSYGEKKSMELCFNAECERTDWEKEDLSGGYFTGVDIDEFKPITSIKIISDHIPDGISYETLITKSQIEEICR
jgi:hypothetical protein